MQSASDTFSEVLKISNWRKYCARCREGEESGLARHARLLAEVPGTSIEYCKGISVGPRSWVLGPGSLVPGSTVFTYPPNR